LWINTNGQQSTTQMFSHSLSSTEKKNHKENMMK